MSQQTLHWAIVIGAEALGAIVSLVVAIVVAVKSANAEPPAKGHMMVTFGGFMSFLVLASVFILTLMAAATS